MRLYCMRMHTTREEHLPARSNLGVAGRHVWVVVAAAALATGVFLLGRHGLGITIEEAGRARVSAASVLGTSAVASALGWSSLMALLRWTDRGWTWWSRIAVAVLLLSLLGPLTAPGLTTAGRGLLVLLHLVVGAATILLLRGQVRDA